MDQAASLFSSHHSVGQLLRIQTIKFYIGADVLIAKRLNQPSATVSVRSADLVDWKIHPMLELFVKQCDH